MSAQEKRPPRMDSAGARKDHGNPTHYEFESYVAGSSRANKTVRCEMVERLRRALPQGPWHLVAFDGEGALVAARMFGPASARAARNFCKHHDRRGHWIGCQAVGTAKEMVGQLVAAADGGEIGARAAEPVESEAVQ